MGLRASDLVHRKSAGWGNLTSATAMVDETTVRPHSSLDYETPEAFSKKKSKGLA
jgi:hypothetical protein